MQGVNLIPASRRDARLQLQRRRRWLLGCTIYGSALVALCIGVGAFFGRDNNAVAADLTKTKQQIGELEKSISTMKPKLVVAERQLQTIKVVANQPDWSVLLALVANNMGDDTVLKRCVLTPMDAPPAPAPTPVKKEAPRPGAAPAVAPAPVAPTRDRFKLDLTGVGQTQTAVSQFVLRLQQTKLFDEVKMIKSNREAFGSDQAVAFQIQATLVEQKKGAK